MHNPLISGRGIVARFAQYAGFRPKAASGKNKAEDKDKDKKKDNDESAESDAPEHGDTGEDPSDDHMESEDDDESMESDDDDEKMEVDDDDDESDDDDDDKKKKDAKKKARAADDDEDKKEARGTRHRARAHAFKQGRRAERARWTKILSSACAAHNLDTALRLAANTSLPSADVIAELRKVGAASASQTRRGLNPRIGVDADGDLAPDQRTTAAVQASWAKAFAPTVEVAQQRATTRR